MRRFAILTLFPLALLAQFGVRTNNGGSGGGGGTPAGPPYTPQVQSNPAGSLSAWPNITVDSLGNTNLKAEFNQIYTIPALTYPNGHDLNKMGLIWDTAGGERTGNTTEQNTNILDVRTFGEGFSAGSPWSINHSRLNNLYKFRSGISQNDASNQFCLSMGDCSNFYMYNYSHAGLTASSDEGTEPLAAQAFYFGGYAGTTSATGAAPSTLSYTNIAGQGPGGNHYLLKGASAKLYYVASTVSPTVATPDHPWSQYVTLGSISPMPYTSTETAVVNTPPPVSTAMGVVTSATPGNASSIAIQRTVTVTLNAAVNGGGAFAAGLACQHGGYIGTGTITSVQAKSGGSQTFTMMSDKPIFTGYEVWQGGPCGLGLVELNSKTMAAVLASHDMTMMPVVGSPSSGVLAVASTFKGGQQGPGYGFIKHDQILGRDPTTGENLINFSNDATSDPFHPHVADSTSVNLVQLSSLVYGNGTVNLVTDNSSWNGPLFHDDASTTLFIRIPGISRGTNLSSNSSYKFANGGAYTGTAHGYIQITGYDYIALAPIAEIAKVDISTSNVYPLTLFANNLPALNSGETLEETNSWFEGGRSVRFGNFMGNSNLRHPEHLDLKGAELSCSHGDDCFLLNTGSDSLTPSGAGVNISGSHNIGLSMTQPIMSPGSPSIPSGIAYSCYRGNCYNTPSSTFNLIRAEGSSGYMDFRFNSGTNDFSWFNGQKVVMMSLGTATINPFLSTQTIKQDGTQSTLLPNGVVTGVVGFMNPLTRYFSSSTIQLVNRYLNDTDGRLGVGPVQENSGYGGLFTGRFDAGQFHGSDMGTFAGVSSGAPAPERVDTTVGGHTDFTITPSANNSTCTSSCAFRDYYFTAYTDFGETPWGTYHNGPGGNYPWGTVAGQNNTITVPNYAQTPKVKGYCAYLTGTDNYFVGCTTIGGTITDNGTPGTPTNGGRNSASLNLTLPMYTPQLNLLGHGLRWMTGALETSPTDLGISRKAVGAVSIDGPTEGDGQGTLAAKSLSTNQAGAVGTTCTVGGYFTATFDGVSRKVAYCN